MADAYAGLSPTAFDFWCGPVFTQADGTLSCPGFTGNTYSKNAWDFVTIAGNLKTPGICEVSAPKARDVDKKKPVGANGARTTIHGIDPATVEISITIWTPEQLKQLQNLLPQIFPQSNKRPPGVSTTEPWPPAFDVQHPILKAQGIKSLIFTAVEPPTSNGRTRVFKIKAVEFLPPSKTKATATPVKPKGNTRDPKPSDYPTPGSNSANTGPT